MKLTFTIALLALLMWGCKKDSPAPAKNTPTGSTPTGSTPTTGGVTITSVSPSSFYADQELTITGTGFNPDKTKDSVFFGIVVDDDGTKVFEPNRDGSVPQAGTTTILSASATQLVVKVTDSSAMDYDAFYNPDTKKYPQFVGIQSKGKYVYSPVNLVPLLQMGSITDIQKQLQTVYYAYPGDTIKFSTLGPIAQNGNFMISGKSVKYKLTTTQPSSFFTENTMVAALAPDFFGGSLNDTATVTVPITVTSASGRTYSKKYTFWASPAMKVTGITIDKSTYSSGGLQNSGGVIKIHVTGQYLKSDTYVQITHLGKVTNSPLGVSGFPNTADIEISPAGLDNGQYNVRLFRDVGGKTIGYGGVEFYLTQ